jgi:hypothetical protein
MPAAGAVKAASSGSATAAKRLSKVISELRGVQKLLASGERLDPRILTDFRDALNHVRNTAWSAHQYITLQGTEQGPTNVLSVLAGERVRAAYQLCQAIQADLKSDDIKFQPGQLVQLCLAAKALIEMLGSVVGKLD